MGFIVSGVACRWVVKSGQDRASPKLQMAFASAEDPFVDAELQGLGFRV